MSQVTGMVNQLETALNLYQSTFDTLIDAVYAARAGHLHPSLITMENLQKIIRQIAISNPDYEFPIHINHARADKLTNLATVSFQG